MPHRDMQQLIEELERNGELLRVREPMDPHLEITALADRAVKSDGPALLLEKPSRGAFPVACNLFGSRARMHRILGTQDPSDIANRYLALLDGAGPQSLIEKIRLLPKAAELNRALPKTVSSGPCQDVVIDPTSIQSLPILKCWPQDGGPTITLPLVFTRDPETGAPNCGMYRMQVYDARTTGMHWHTHKGGAEHLRAARRLGLRRLPVSVAIGGPPLATFAAMCPLPPGVDEMLLAGLIGGRPVEMVRCRTNDLLVPARADFVLEGWVDTQETRTEGPFGDHTGFYSLPDEYPVFHIEAVTHRRDAVYPATVVGRPPMEDCYMGEAVERLFLPVIRWQLPEIVDMHMPFAGVFHNMLLVSIRKAWPGHARKVMHALWGLGQVMFAKVIVVLDADERAPHAPETTGACGAPAALDLRDYNQVAWRVLNHIDPQRDMEFVLGPVDALDHASRLPGYGSHVGIDATRKWPEEGFTRPWPDEMRLPDDVLQKAEDLWKRIANPDKPTEV